MVFSSIVEGCRQRQADIVKSRDFFVDKILFRNYFSIFYWEGERLIQAEIIETPRNNVIDAIFESDNFDLLEDVQASGQHFQTGKKFYDSLVRDKLTAKTMKNCAQMCSLKPYCRTFAFR